MSCRLYEWNNCILFKKSDRQILIGNRISFSFHCVWIESEYPINYSHKLEICPKTRLLFVESFDRRLYASFSFERGFIDITDKVREMIMKPDDLVKQVCDGLGKLYACPEYIDDIGNDDILVNLNLESIHVDGYVIGMRTFNCVAFVHMNKNGEIINNQHIELIDCEITSMCMSHGDSVISTDKNNIIWLQTT